MSQFESRLSSSWDRQGRWLALLLAVVLVAGLPMLQLKQMSGHDALEYLPRAAEFYRELSEGQIWPGWAPDLSQGYGQPFFLFNPPVIYYLTALFHFLGASLVASLNLALLLLLALAGLGMYFFSKELFGQAGGVAVGAAYVLAPFTLVNLYVRYAMADYAAMAFIPWALWGLYRWVMPQPARVGRGPEVKALVVAAFSIALIFLSSNPVSLFAVPLLAVYTLFLALRAGRQPGRSGWLPARGRPALGRGAWALALGVALPAFFWLPAILERHWVKVSNLLGGYLNYGNHFVYLQQLFFSRWGYGISEAGPGDEMSFGLGAVHLAMLVAAVVLARKLVDEEEGQAHLWFFVGVLGVTAFLVTDNSLLLWNGLPLLQYLEFPWRTLVLGALATAFLCGVPFLLAKTPRARAWLLALVLGALVVFNVPHAHPEFYQSTTDADYAPAVIAAKGIEVTTTGEYEPTWAEQRPEQPAPASRLLLMSGQVKVLEQQLSSIRYNWLIEASGPAQLRVTTLYYPGWRIWVDGQPEQPAVQNPYGMIDLFLPAGTHRVEMAFGTTALRQVALGVSIAALVLVGVTWGWVRVRRRET